MINCTRSKGSSQAMPVVVVVVPMAAVLAARTEGPTENDENGGGGYSDGIHPRRGHRESRRIM